MLTRVVELVDTRDLKSRPLGCQFDSGHGYYEVIPVLKKIKNF